MSRYDGLIIPRSYSEYINKTDAATLLQALQLSGVMDSAPTANSNHPTKSSGVYTALAGKQATLTFDDAPTSGSNNPVKSGGIYTNCVQKTNVYTNTINAVGWYRIAGGTVAVTGESAEIAIETAYNYNASSSRKLIIAIGFNTIGITQLTKADADGVITKIRAYQSGSGSSRQVAVDIYYTKIQVNPVNIEVVSHRNILKGVDPYLVTGEPGNPTVLDI